MFRGAKVFEKIQEYRMAALKPDVLKHQHILMLGTSLSTPGGITSVVRTLKDAGFFCAAEVMYVPTYEAPGLKRQIRVVSSAFKQVFGMLLAGQVSLIHAHSASRGSFWRKSFFCALAGLFRVPYVFHIHSGEFPVFYASECGVLAKWWVRRTLRNAATVICLTDAWIIQFSAIEPKARLVVIGNPVATPAFLPPLRVQAVEVLFLGRLRKKKGVFDLVQALPSVLAQCPQLRLILAGDDGEDAVRTYADELGVAGSVEVTGWVDGEQKATLLENADIFVLPSYFEGLPVGLLEAMALGIPIISTPVGGIPDLIENGVHGLLVPPGDLPALAEAITRLGSDAQLRKVLREAAFKRVQENYSLPVIQASLSDLYRSVEGCGTN